MLTQERFNTILNLLEEKGAVTVQELSEVLGTSESTVKLIFINKVFMMWKPKVNLGNSSLKNRSANILMNFLKNLKTNSFVVGDVCRLR